MYKLIICCFVAASVSAAPQNPADATDDHNYDGSFNLQYETRNGIAAQESGPLADPESGTADQGSFSYNSSEEPISLIYTADENGPQGAHLPPATTIPPEILKALEYIRSHPPPPQTQYGRR